MSHRRKKVHDIPKLSSLFKAEKKLSRNGLECCFWTVFSCGKEIFEKLMFVYILWFFVVFQHFVHFDNIMSLDVDVYQLWAIFMDQTKKLIKQISQFSQLCSDFSVLIYYALFYFCVTNKAIPFIFYWLVFIIWSKTTIQAW